MSQSHHQTFRSGRGPHVLFALGMLMTLCGCPWPSGDLEGTWTNELDGGELSFRGDTIDWYGDRGSFTTGERKWFVHYRYDAGWIDAQLSESRYFGYDFHANGKLLTLWEVRDGEGLTHHFTKNGSGISLDAPTDWNLAMEGLGRLPDVANIVPGATKTFLFAARMAYNPKPRDPPDLRQTTHLYVSDGDDWQELSLPLDVEYVSASVFRVSGTHLAILNTANGELMASADEGQSFTTYREDQPPWALPGDDDPARLHGVEMAIIGDDLFLAQQWHESDGEADDAADDDCDDCEDDTPSDTRIYRLDNFASETRGTWSLIAAFEGRSFPFDESDEWPYGIVGIGTDLGLMHGGKFFRSSDRGMSWQELSAGLPTVPGANFLVQGRNLIVASGEHSDEDRQYVLESGSTRWRELGASRFRATCANETSLYGSMRSGWDRPWSWGTSQLYKTDDLGETLTPLGAAFEHPRNRRLRALCGQGGRVFADTRLDDSLHPPPATTLFEALNP